MWDKNNKKVILYTAFEISNPQQILTITPNKEDALDYILKFLRIKHFDHFKMWCELRGLDVSTENAWLEYFNSCIDNQERRQYAVAKRKYTLNQVAAIMRMFGGCMPLGCTFDTPAEYNYLRYKLETQEVAAKLMKNNVKEKIDKILKEEFGESENGKQ